MQMTLLLGGNDMSIRKKQLKNGIKYAFTLRYTDIFGNTKQYTSKGYDTKKEAEVIEIVDNLSKNWNKFPLQWVSVGQFMPYVVFLAPVLNVELYSAATEVYSELTELGDVSIRNCYKPFQWLPHTTLAKMLSQEEMLSAVKLLHSQFGVVKGTATRIALAKTNPHMDIAVFDLK